METSARDSSLSFRKRQTDRPGRTLPGSDGDPAPLSRTDRAELDRRLRELEDPTRYVVVSPFSWRFNLFYQVPEGTFVMNEITGETLFKNRADALAVAKVLDGRRSRRAQRTLQVIAVRKTAKGVRILEDVVSPRNPREKWKPKLRRS